MSDDSGQPYPGAIVDEMADAMRGIVVQYAVPLRPDLAIEFAVNFSIADVLCRAADASGRTEHEVFAATHATWCDLVNAQTSLDSDAWHLSLHDLVNHFQAKLLTAEVAVPLRLEMTLDVAQAYIRAANATRTGVGAVVAAMVWSFYELTVMNPAPSNA